jgi:biopolymer transport protein ExbB
MLTTGLPKFGPSDLPKVNNPIWAADADEDDAIVLVVMYNGRVFWRKDPISIDGLRHELCHRLERNPQAQIYLAVDAHASYGNVAKLLAALRSIGVAKVVFLVDQRKSRTSVVGYSQPAFWNLARLWHSMDWLGRADFMFLALMLANTGAVICFRLYRYNTARRESRTFIRDAASVLRDGKFDEVITLAARNSRSHVANIVVGVLAAYASAPPEFTNTEAIAAAQRAFQRRSKFLAAHLKRGLNTFITIASSAPFIGFLGTVIGMEGSFVGTTGPPSEALARLASEIAEALILGAMGLLVSVFAVWCFNYLRSRFEVLENEMSNSELEAVACLKTHPQWREQFEHSSAAKRIFAVADASAARTWEVPYDRQRPLLLAMWCCALFLAYVLARGVWSSLYP